MPLPSANMKTHCPILGHACCTPYAIAGLQPRGVLPLQQAQPIVAPNDAAARAPAEEREFAFNELIGLDGPLRMLLENAATVIFTTWAFLTAALWMPFMLGRIAIATLVGLQVRMLKQSR